MGRVTEQSSLERGDDSRIRLFEWFRPPALKMACSQRRTVHLLPRRRSSHFPSLRTTLRAPGPAKSPTATLPLGLQFLNRGITKIPEKESTPVGVDIEFYFDSRQCCEKKENSHRQVRASKQARPFEEMGLVSLGLPVVGSLVVSHPASAALDR